MYKEIGMATLRKAVATKGGKVHWAYGHLSLCSQYVGYNDEKIDKEVNCKNCLKKEEALKTKNRRG